MAVSKVFGGAAGGKAITHYMLRRQKKPVYLDMLLNGGQR